MNLQFSPLMNKGRAEVDVRAVQLSMRICKKIARVFFEEDESLLSNFMQNVDQYSQDFERVCRIL